ncbi:hypothetical protein GWI33_017046 [Rhynchophorus ferrugineus]|uniref:Uncharacterized protein n=1 Tax=Rhynchophorus ferrugineus TaxID=354439 RepID=A0A834M6K3_RHYFE|nr:hypothetical protein GWI33_017046 [Rhynchophorus ferrugineus]
MPNMATLNLRDTKSVTCNMDIPQKELEQIKITDDGDDDYLQISSGIQTKDLYNNDIVLVNKEALIYQGKRYSINDIAFSWKKDCRMWLWKNSWELRKNKSVSDHLATKFVHI